MRRVFSVRLIVAGVMALAAACANAFTINLSSVGPWANPGVPDFNTLETVIFQSSSIALPAMNTLYWEIPTINPTITPGDGFYINTAATDGFTFNTIHDTSQISQNGGTQSLSGTWTYTGGTGAFANLSGGGTFAITLNLNAPRDAMFTLAGELTTVPEPASMAAIGVGAIGFFLRRRKRA